MYIVYLKTKTNMIAREMDDFSKAWHTLNRLAEGRTDLVEALVLEEIEELDDQDPDFSSCRIAASRRLV